MVDKQEKKDKIEKLFKEIMLTMDLPVDEDPSIMKTPYRVAKMFVDEVFSGLFDERPTITSQPNAFDYDQMLIESNIKVHSFCEHHFVPILGACHLAYIPKDKVIGLSKFNRLVNWHSRRPQVQEKLTQNIKQDLIDMLGTEDVAVVIDGIHLCVKMRGIKDQNTITRTSALSGVFKEGTSRAEFFSSIPKMNELKI